MKTKKFAIYTVCLLAGITTLTGCHKQSATTPVDIARVPAEMKSAFRDSNPELQAQIASLEEAAQKQDPAAVSALLDVMHRPDLTPEQHAAAARCLPPLLNAARQAAAQGDQRATEALKDYQVSK
jgi:hypothetical protein